LSPPVRTALLKFMETNQEPMMDKAIAKAPHLRKGRCSIERVHRGNQVQYRVAEFLPALNLVIKSQYVSSLDVAIEMCVILVRTGAVLSRTCWAEGTAVALGKFDHDVVIPADDTAAMATTLASSGKLQPGRTQDAYTSFQSALLGACQGSNLSLSSLRLSFCARVTCICVQRQIQGRCTQDLREALMHTEQLQKAGQADWSNLRSQLICIRQPPTQKRRRLLDIAEAAAGVDKTAATRLSHAVAAAEKAFREAGGAATELRDAARHSNHTRKRRRSSCKDLLSCSSHMSSKIRAWTQQQQQQQKKHQEQKQQHPKK